MMYFSAHYTDREPAYFMAVDWPQGARHGATLGTMITLYWLAEDGRLAAAQADAEMATP